MLLDEIKKANVQAMRDKNMTARNIYGVLMNKIMLEGIKRRDGGEPLADADIINIIRKTIKELEEERENYVKAGKTEQANEIGKQLEVVKVFMPIMLSEAEIKDIIDKLSDKSVPSVMKYFTTNYAGKCDMKTVSMVLKGSSTK